MKSEAPEMSFREPDEWEREFLDGFASVDLPSIGALKAQLAHVLVEEQEDGYIDLQVPEDSPSISYLGFPIDAWYFDTDGMVVFVMLHAASSLGRITVVERYRPDAQPIVSLRPARNTLRYQARTKLPEAGSSRYLDPERGWVEGPRFPSQTDPPTP